MNSLTGVKYQRGQGKLHTQTTEQSVSQHFILVIGAAVIKNQSTYYYQIKIAKADLVKKEDN